VNRKRRKIKKKKKKKNENLGDKSRTYFLGIEPGGNAQKNREGRQYVYCEGSEQLVVRQCDYSVYAAPGG